MQRHDDVAALGPDLHRIVPLESDIDEPFVRIAAVRHQDRRIAAAGFVVPGVDDESACVATVPVRPDSGDPFQRRDGGIPGSQADKDRQSTRLNSSPYCATRMPYSACKT